MKESDVLRAIRLKLAKVCTLFRNNSGKFKDHAGRWVQFGVGVGGSDLLGYQTRKIKSDDIGKKIAVFVALEIKTEKELRYIERHREELIQYQGHDEKKCRYRDQLNFIARVNEAGGIAGMASSEEEAEAIIKGGV